MSIIKTYSELLNLSTFKDRYNYLKLNGQVGKDTFGFDRYLNQKFYKSPEWLSVRRKVIIRDNGCDLGISGREINKQKILIHHINPITKDDIINRSSKLFDMDNLICTTKKTHDAIHYGDENSLTKDLVIRTKNDTCPWRR